MNPRGADPWAPTGKIRDDLGTQRIIVRVNYNPLNKKEKQPWIENDIPQKGKGGREGERKERREGGWETGRGTDLYRELLLTACR